MVLTPWLPEAAQRFLQDRLNRTQSETRVLEWGAGGSTLMFAAAGAHVVSVEHTQKWYWIVEHQLLVTGQFRHVDLMHVPPDQEPAAPLYWDNEGRSMERYVERPAEVAKARWKKVDVILIDGRARVACCHRASHLLAKGGVVVLDDTRRARYAPGIAQLTRAFGKPRDLGGALGWEHRG